MEAPVFRLIKKLSGPEKRYFKLFAGTYQKNEDRTAIQVFDFLEQLDVYSEAALKEKFATSSFAPQLPVIKTQLFHLILNSLRKFNQKRSFGLQFSAWLDKIEMLYQLELYDSCRKLINKTHQKALKMELPTKQLELLGWKMRIARQSPDRKMKETLALFYEQESKALEQIAAESKLRQLHDEVYTLFIQRTFSRDETVQESLKTLMAEPLLIREITLAFDGRIIFHYIHLYESLLTGKPQKAVDQYSAMTQLWEAYPIRMQFEPERYFRTLNGYLDICIQFRIFKDTTALIQKIRLLLEGSQKLKSKYEYRANAVILRYYLNTGSYLEGADWVQTLQQDLLSRRDKIPGSMAISLFYNLAILYFILERFSDCLIWLNRILNQVSDQSREDLRVGTRTLSMIVHYEMGNWELVHSIVRSLSRFIHQQSSVYEFESLVGKSLKKLINIDPSETPHVIFKELQLALIEVEKGNEIPMESEVRAWVESKLAGKPLAEILRGHIEGSLAAEEG